MKLALVVVAGAATSAQADPVKSVALDRELVLEVSGKSLVARDGKRFTPLHDVTEITTAKVDKVKRTIALESSVPESVSCGGMSVETFGFDELRAKIENRYAYLLHVKKDYKAAAEGYAKAIALDPKWRIPAYNLAGVLTDLKDLDGAIKTLAPWLKSEPVTTYLQVSRDTELQPLLARPELAAIIAKKPASATTKFRGALYSAELGLVAVPQMTSPFISCTVDARVELYEIATGKLAGKLPATGDIACEEMPGGGPQLLKVKSPDMKLDAAGAAMLGKLGFAGVTLETSAEPQSGADDKWTAVFTKAKLGIVLKDNKLNVLKGNSSLGTGEGMSKLAASHYLPDVNVVIVHSYMQGMESCGEDPHRLITVIKLK